MGVAVLVVIALCAWALATLFAVALLVLAWRADRAGNDTRRLNVLERHLAQEIAIGFDSAGWVRVEDCYGMELGVGGDLRAALDQVELDDQDLERV
jgi:hypothetical protein